MNTRTAEEDLLNDAQFDPVFDQNGKLVDIVDLEVKNDRSRGLRAMDELAQSKAPFDDVILSDGWTGKQKRILETAAPGAAHTIRRTKRWDAKAGDFIPSATLILPYEVTWNLFEQVFPGSYSVKIDEVEYSTEDIAEVAPVAGTAVKNAAGRIFYARARVTISIHLQNGSIRQYEGLGIAYDSLRMSMTGNTYAINSARRTAEKGAISDAKREALANMGRVFRRAFEDGAEALRAIEEKLMEKMRAFNANIPQKESRPIVRAPRKIESVQAKKIMTAAQNGKGIEETRDEQSDYVSYEQAQEQRAQEKRTKAENSKEAQKTSQEQSDLDSAKGKSETLAKGQENARVDLKTTQPKTVNTLEKVNASTKSDTHTKTDVVVKNDKQKESQKQTTEIKPRTVAQGYKFQLIDGTIMDFSYPQEVFDAALNEMENAKNEADRASILECNKTTLLQAEKDANDPDIQYSELEFLIKGEVEEEARKEEDDIPDFVLPDESLRLTPKSMKGDDIIKAYKDAFSQKDAKIDKILDANKELAKKLTKRQFMDLISLASKMENS